MAKLSYAELLVFASNVITAAKISINTFNETRDNTAGLLDKIGKIVTLDSNYAIDKLNEFDGEFLSFGKTIEEWAADLIEPEQFDASGSGALSPHRSTYRPVFYSYTTGKYVVKQTIDYNDLERAVHFVEQYVELIAMKYKRISDSMAQYRYALKREMIAKFYGLASASDLGLSGSDADTGTWTAAKTAQWGSTMGEKAVNGLYVLAVNITGETINGKYIAVKNIAAASTASLADLIANGSLIKLDLVTEIAKPVDDTTGEAFIKQLKSDVEIASDSSEGHSLNGNSLGATEGLRLILKQGIMPSVEVDTLAGAFQLDKLAMPVQVIVVKDFGSCDSKVYGMLVDVRGMRLHNTFNGTYENLNGDGAFLNVFRHTEDTAYISRNCFVKFYKEA